MPERYIPVAMKIVLNGAYAKSVPDRELVRNLYIPQVPRLRIIGDVHTYQGRRRK